MDLRNGSRVSTGVSKQDYSDHVRGLSLALRAMHRELLDAEVSDSALASTPQGSAFDRMQRLLHDPAMAWLKPISDLMVDLDGMVAESATVDEAEAREARRRAEELFGPSEPEQRHAIQQTIANLTYSHPKLTMALGDLRRALDQLPETGDQG